MFGMLVTMSSPHTLLVVDDDPAIRVLIPVLLEGTKWQVDTVASGEEALARLETHQYDLILSDILMAGMDGLSLLGRIRALYPDARVVMMTVKNTPDHIVGSLQHDATGYLSKPFFRESLIEALQNALSTPHNADDIKVLSDRPNWISLQLRCKLETADRLTQFVRQLPSDLKQDEREHIAIAFRELLLNAVEHGGRLDPEKTVDISYIRTARSILYYIRDPGEGFSIDNLAHAAVSNNSDEPFRHVALREEQGIRPGGFGLLMTKNFADEVIYSGKGNEVLLIKYL